LLVLLCPFYLTHTNQHGRRDGDEQELGRAEAQHVRGGASGKRGGNAHAKS